MTNQLHILVSYQVFFTHKPFNFDTVGKNILPKNLKNKICNKSGQLVER